VTNQQPCCHPTAVRNRSVETGVEFCDMCRLNEMLHDALTMEAHYKAELDGERARVARLHQALRAIADSNITRDTLAGAIICARAALGER